MFGAIERIEFVTKQRRQFLRLNVQHTKSRIFDDLLTASWLNMYKYMAAIQSAYSF